MNPQISPFISSPHVVMSGSTSNGPRLQHYSLGATKSHKAEKPKSGRRVTPYKNLGEGRVLLRHALNVIIHPCRHLPGEMQRTVRTLDRISNVHFNTRTGWLIPSALLNSKTASSIDRSDSTRSYSICVMETFEIRVQ